MDKLDKSYIWHIITLSKMKLRVKEIRKGWDVEMKQNKLLESLIKEQEEAEIYFKEQVKNNTLNSEFRVKSIDLLIDEMLTKLTDVNLKGNRYLNETPYEIIHTNIEDLEKLYLIRNLECSYKSNNRNN